MNNTEIKDITAAARERRSIRFLMLALSGILTGLCLVISKIGFIEWLTLVPCALFLLILASKDGLRLRALYGYGVFFFASFYIVNFHWFVDLYPLDFIDGMTKGAAVCVVCVAWIGLSLLQAVQGGLVFVLAGIVFRSSACRRFALLKPFLLGAIWALYEWSQTFGWWGVPWGRLPLGQSRYLVGLQTASWFGPYFITFIIVCVNSCVALALINKTDKRRVRLCCIAVVSMLLFQYGAGSVIWLSHKDVDRTVRVAAVQGNISSHEKWDASSNIKTQTVYAQYTKEAASKGASIVVWPETALPYTIRKGSGYYKFVSDIAKENNVTILVGAFTVNDEGYYNSLICFTPDGETLDNIYAKRRLVPFGEFVPLRSLIETVVPPLAELVMSGEEISQGSEANLFVTNEWSIGSLICFDSIYEGLTRDSVLEGADIICLSTNDSWFTDSAALYMHNAQAQLRAIESGRDIVRSANTGISTVINSRGEVTASLAPLVDGLIVEDVSLRSDLTLYTRIGNLFVYLLGLAIVFVIALDVFSRFSKKVKKQ